jgi:aspartate/methionine/tyrosine aminotransferase
MSKPREAKAAPRISRRGEGLGNENAFVVLPEDKELARRGRDIVSPGQPDFPTPANIQDAAVAAIRAGNGHAVGRHDELRCRGARPGHATRPTINPDELVIRAGAKPCLAYAIASVTDFGAEDEVIYPVPGFPIYESQIVANGALPVPIHLREARDFAFDPHELEAKITAKTRLLILNSPHNPTGASLKPADLAVIAGILRRHPQVWVYADEIYSRLCYDGKFASLASLPGMLERTIISDGASKTWAMTGWRLGYVANRALAPIFTRWITNTDSCASQISQWAALEAITGPQADAEAMRSSFLERAT